MLIVELEKYCQAGVRSFESTGIARESAMVALWVFQTKSIEIRRNRPLSHTNPLQFIVDLFAMVDSVMKALLLWTGISLICINLKQNNHKCRPLRVVFLRFGWISSWKPFFMWLSTNLLSLFVFQLSSNGLSPPDVGLFFFSSPQTVNAYWRHSF